MAENRGNKKRAERLSTTIKKKIFIESLNKSLGIIAPAMEAAGIKNGQTIRDWRKKDEDFAEAMKECEARCGDFVESALLKKIQNGDTAAIIFYCKTKLKDRGYSERNEITGKDGKDLLGTPEVDIAALTDEQRKVLLGIGLELAERKE